MQARTVEYLRVSVTDRCNYRCTYCMPAEGAQLVPRPELLDFDEIATLVRVFVSLGVRKVRLTGGEPLVRRDIVRLVDQLANIAGIDDLSMTTNGHLLAELAAPLRKAGLQRLNVSLDTLDPGKFARVTRQGSLDAVVRGLEAAQAAGFVHTKINTVALRGLNDDELLSLCDFAADRGLVLRLIEYMPIGVDQFWGPDTYLPVADIRALLAAGWDLAPVERTHLPGGGPARHWIGRSRAQPSRTVHLGFIAAVSEKFCRLCNRVRLSSTGTLRECLSAAGTLSLRDMLRGGASNADLKAAIHAALHGKVDAHRFDGAVHTREPMSAIGG
ncbi:MAG: GTP 3',8-cyclase MoaA [Deltaproteobacteria bacterium]|nr:GTP 3',8-cyclase MoaA [Deltaproteobacteria bacterium]